VLSDAVRDAWASLPAPPADDLKYMAWGWGEEAAREFTGVAPMDVDLALLRDVATDQQKNRQDTKAAKEELQGPPRHLPLLFPCFLAPLAPWRFASQPYFPQ
jgi:hypothetical protein